jgi:hypothetical protein
MFAKSVSLTQGNLPPPPLRRFMYTHFTQQSRNNYTEDEMMIRYDTVMCGREKVSTKVGDRRHDIH